MLVFRVTCGPLLGLSALGSWLGREPTLLLAKASKPVWFEKKRLALGRKGRGLASGIRYHSWRMVLAFGERAQGFVWVSGALFWWAGECSGVGWGEVQTVALWWLV